MKEFFAKYLAQYPLVHPNNCRETWFPKVGGKRRAPIERTFRKGEHFIVIFADESEVLRTNKEYQLASNVLLVPKVFLLESARDLAFHLDLKFPDDVNAVTVSDALDSVRRDFHVDQSDVRLFVRDSPPYMVLAAERLNLHRAVLIA